MGGNDHHFEAINALEFVRLGIGGAGHARQLGVHAEIILESDAGQRLVLALNWHAFLGLDRLMKAIRPAPPSQGAAGKFINDDHFLVADDVINIALEQGMRAQRSIQMMDDGQVVGRIQRIVAGEDAVTAQQLLGMLHAGFGQMHLLLFFIHPVIALAFFTGLLDQTRNDFVGAQVQFWRFVGLAGDDQRRARFIDQD